MEIITVDGETVCGKYFTYDECFIIVPAPAAVGLMSLKKKWALSLVVNFITWNNCLSQPRDSGDLCPASPDSGPRDRESRVGGKASCTPTAKSRGSWRNMAMGTYEFGQHLQRVTVTKRQKSIFF